jgi:hypothetical protein
VTVVADDFLIEDDNLNNDMYAQEYGEQYTNKIKQLKEEITKGNTGTDNFNIFSIEAGLGKSRETLKIIDENLYNWENQRSFLLVKRFNDDIERSVEQLKHHNNAFQTNVLGITSNSWSKEWRMKKDKLKDIPVLIISHERYIRLCLDDEIRQAFTENREVLVIDEKVNFPVYSFSKSYYDKVRSILPYTLQGELDKVCEKLLRELQKHEVKNKDKNKCVRCEPKIHHATLDRFKRLMEVNIENVRNMEDRNTIENFMKGLDLWYTTKCVYNGGNISTFNRKHTLWGLQNNIILDASAYVDGVYQLLNNYKLIGQERIVDHSNCSFTVIDFNSSKGNLKKNEKEFYKEICEKIQANHKPSDKTLIICHKNDYKRVKEQLNEIGIIDIGEGDKYDKEDFAINWYGNLTGKNHYAEFTQCWLIGTPNLPYEHYLIHYMMYSKSSDLGRKSLEIEHGRFKNEEFRKVQVGYIASEIYQSIKRIQRNAKPQGEFFIVNSDKEIISKVLNQIKGSSDFERIQLDFDIKRREEKKKGDNVDKFIGYIRYLPVGMHPKKKFKDRLQITNLDRILRDSRVKDLEETGVIKIYYRAIEKLKTI